MKKTLVAALAAGALCAGISTTTLASHSYNFTHHYLSSNRVVLTGAFVIGPRNEMLSGDTSDGAVTRGLNDTRIYSTGTVGFGL